MHPRAPLYRKFYNFHVNMMTHHSPTTAPYTPMPQTLQFHVDIRPRVAPYAPLYRTT